MNWLIGLFGAAIVRYIISGAAIMTVIGAFWIWHSANYVQKAEYKALQENNLQLRQAAEDKEKMAIQAEREKIDADAKIEELEQENEKLHQQDKRDFGADDPVLIPRGDLKRLRR